MIKSRHVGITENNRVFIQSAHLFDVTIHVPCPVVRAFSLLPGSGKTGISNNNTADGHGMDYLP